LLLIDIKRRGKKGRPHTFLFRAIYRRGKKRRTKKGDILKKKVRGISLLFTPRDRERTAREGGEENLARPSVLFFIAFWGGERGKKRNRSLHFTKKRRRGRGQKEGEGSEGNDSWNFFARKKERCLISSPLKGIGRATVKRGGERARDLLDLKEKRGGKKQSYLLKSSPTVRGKGDRLKKKKEQPVAPSASGGGEKEEGGRRSFL